MRPLPPGDFWQRVRKYLKTNRLTRTPQAYKFLMMRSVKPILLAVLAVALARYAFDCGATTTPEQAMQCCNSMPCSPHGHHAQDCCKTMQAMHAPFVQPSSVHGVSSSTLAFAVLPATSESLASGSPNRVIAALCHAPPIRYAPTAVPLRI
jgi:hypothetical protein